MQNLNLRVLFSHLQKWHVLLGLILISYFVFPIIIMTFDTYNIERFTSMLDLSSSTYSVRSMVHDWHLKCISEYVNSSLNNRQRRFLHKLYAWGAESTIIHIVEYYGLIIFGVFLFAIFYHLWSQRDIIDLSSFVLLLVLGIYMWNWRLGFTFQGVLIWYFLFMNRKTVHA